MAIYFQGFGEKGHLLSGIWGESITFWGFREQGAEEKHYRELGRKVIFLSGSKHPRPPGGGAHKQFTQKNITRFIHKHLPNLAPDQNNFF